MPLSASGVLTIENRSAFSRLAETQALRCCPWFSAIDLTAWLSVVLMFMVKNVQAGQVWRNDENGANFLVTKVYSELFTQYAMLRPASKDAPNAESIRVKVSREDEGMRLPGYTFTQDSQEF